jgi:hypothetical protein
MWLLFIVFMGPGMFTTQELARYDTIQECQVERDRVWYEMEQSYPDEGDFQIECRYQVPQLNQRRT